MSAREFPSEEEKRAYEDLLKEARCRIEAERKATIEKHEAAMQVMKAQMLALEQAQDLDVQKMIEMEEVAIEAVLQEFDRRAAARRVYHEAPNDVFELIVLQFPNVDEDGWGEGGLNALRLVSKRCLRVVESVATRLAHSDNPESLPLASVNRCKRIEHIRCNRLKSLEGCPDELKSLFIRQGQYLESLEPLSACKELEILKIRHAERISVLFPLLSCKRLKKLELGSPFIKDLSPLCQCPDLEELSIWSLPLINDLSFFEKGFTKLRLLYVGYHLPVNDLSPLTRLQNLEELICWGIPSTPSLLPLVKCYKLKMIRCRKNAMGLEELRERRPDIILSHVYP